MKVELMSQIGKVTYAGEKKQTIYPSGENKEFCLKFPESY